MPFLIHLNSIKTSGKKCVNKKKKKINLQFFRRRFSSVLAIVQFCSEV